MRSLLKRLLGRRQPPRIPTHDASPGLADPLPPTSSQLARMGTLFDEILDSHQRPAIILKRPYPTSPSHTGRSKLRGLPQLPEEFDWPIGFGKHLRGREPQNVAMHFLAQIDCSELPPIRAEMPRTGMLFFFALIDETTDWDRRDPVSDYAAVIFAPDVPKGTPMRAPPSNMIPYGDAQQSDHWPGHLWPTEVGPSVYPEWPVTPVGFISYPMAEQVYDMKQRALSSGFTAQQFSRFEMREAFEANQALRQKVSFDEVYPEKKAVVTPKIGSVNSGGGTFLREEDVFPGFGALLYDAASAIGHVAATRLQHLSQVNKWSRDRDRKTSEDADALNDLEQSARTWMARAEQIGIDNPVSPQDRKNFQKWLGEEVDAAGAGSVNYDKVFPRALRRTIQRAAVKPGLWRFIDTRYLDHMYGDHDPCEICSVDGEIISFAHKTHQMGGYFQSSQAPLPYDDARMPLLHLNSDYGLDFMFGDVGELQFLIGPEDLRNRDFSEISVILNGH